MSRVSLRTGIPAGLFGSEANEAAWLDACEVQRDSMRERGVRFACAPAPVTYVSPTGRIFVGGETITAADLHHGERPAWALLEDAVRAGLVLEA